MSSVAENKREIRREYRQKRKNLNAEIKAARDTSLCRLITDTKAFKDAEAVLMYAPTADEVDIMPVAEAALTLGKRVYFPLCNTEDNTLSFHRVLKISELEMGHYGILAPPTSSPTYNNESVTASLCLVPGLVFDDHGYRVGYGKGYYDRFLSQFSGMSAGVVYSDFITEDVPRNEFDLKVDMIITERNVKAPRED
ncbi:MAG: 5-formyltetrahydrofolate cyclo-ligase [Clostridia bacterium]|nr:5-formyltetrahydrofolate cyclo-ligase [Clostridia bacterium]